VKNKNNAHRFFVAAHARPYPWSNPAIFFGIIRHWTGDCPCCKSYTISGWAEELFYVKQSAAFGRLTSACCIYDKQLQL
jgi:hypothetical protein